MENAEGTEHPYTNSDTFHCEVAAANAFVCIVLLFSARCKKAPSPRISPMKLCTATIDKV